MSNRHTPTSVGDKFGMLTVIAKTDKRTSGRHIIFRWRCDCGNVVDREASHIRDGVVVSCGCFGKEARRKAHLKHGHAVRGKRNALHGAWVSMRGRCNNPNNANYHNYGGRGISVCPEWDDFDTFLRDMGERPSNRHSIDRIDNDGNYEPENCRWALQSTQMRNTRTCKAVKASDGREFGSLAEAAEAVGITSSGISACIKGRQQTAGGLGWTLLRATSTEAGDV